jgi:hypothetical protein
MSGYCKLYRTVSSSLVKCGCMDRICICGMQPVIRMSCSLRYTVFAHMQVHAVNMWVHAVNMRIHVVNIRVHAVYMRVHAVYNVIVECFSYYSLFKNKKKLHICVRICGRIPHMWYAVTFRMHEQIHI